MSQDRRLRGHHDRLPPDAVDPLVTRGIAVYILWRSFREIGPVIRILVLGSSPDLAVRDVIARLERIDGVSDLHQTRL